MKKRKKAYRGKVCPCNLSNIPFFVAALIFFSISIFHGKARAQEEHSTQLAQSPLGGLQIGDRIPDLTIRNIINHPTTEAKISDFKDQLLILDFGNTRCAPCIVSQEKMAALEKELNGAFKLLAITHEPKEKVQKFGDKRGWSFSFVTQDTALKKLFPHLAVPHLVWVRDSHVLAITNAYDATAENIRKVVKGEEVSFTPKWERRYDPWERLAKLDPLGKTTLFYSQLSGFLAGVGSSYARPTLDNGNTKFSWINHDPVSLISEAFKGKDPHLKHPNRWIFAVSDSLMRRLSQNYKLPSTDASAQLKWAPKHAISYEIETRLKDQKKVEELMRQELNTFFKAYYGIAFTVEKRNIPCLVLLRTSNGELFQTEGGERARKVEENIYSINNMPMAKFVRSLVYQYRIHPLPVVDKTDYTGNVDLHIQGGLGELSRLNRELKKYGLTLQEKTLDINMLIIRQLDEQGQPLGLQEHSILPYYQIGA